MSNFVTGLLIGGFLGILLILPKGLDECRAQNPGFDCDLGWVIGAAF